VKPHAWLTVVSTATVTAVACILIAAGVGLATRRSSNVLTMRPGDLLVVPSVDVSCQLFATDPDHHDPGPLLFCDRNSVANNPRKPGTVSASLGASRYHFRLGASGSAAWVDTVTRSP
jgi:hypothetical protein